MDWKNEYRQDRKAKRDKLQEIKADLDNGLVATVHKESIEWLVKEVERLRNELSNI